MSKHTCRLCGKDSWQTGGWLERMNVGELPSVWECRPACDTPQMAGDERILRALETSATASPTGERGRL